MLRLSINVMLSDSEESFETSSTIFQEQVLETVVQSRIEERDQSLSTLLPSTPQRPLVLNPNSVCGNDLRARRRLQQNLVPHLSSQRAVFDFLGIENIRPLTLDEGQVLVPSRLAHFNAQLSPTQLSTPRDGNCLFHSLLDQLQ